MKSDIDNLMQQRNLNALLVLGNAESNPPMTYLTGGGHVTAATLLKKQGEPAVLFCNPMERDEAAKSGLKIRLYNEFPWQDLLTEANGDGNLAVAIRLSKIFLEMGVAGRVGVYGHTDLSSGLAVLQLLKEIMPSVEFIGESRENSLFMHAMETKDAEEIARIRNMGKITTEVVGLTAELLMNSKVNADQVLLKNDGSLLKLGDVKAQINLWLAERGAVPSEGYIFSIGRDAAVPHSQGNPEDLMRLGQTIVFDIYPQEAGGGYFYDFTRTWSLGYASPTAQKLYTQVYSAYQTVVERLKINASFHEYQLLTCDIFEELGHNTPRTNKSALEGYIHSVGHGVGLNIHERPASGYSATNKDVLKAGVVITIEPGLYYPDDGMGFRVEDTFCVNEDGKIELLAEYPYDFVLPMKFWQAE